MMILVTYDVDTVASDGAKRLYVQSQLLARFIREDLNDYPVFLIK